MLIVCGESREGMVRVFDTNENVVEEWRKELVDAVREQGYPVEIDYSYDFYYKIMLKQALPYELCDLTLEQTEQIAFALDKLGYSLDGRMVSGLRLQKPKGKLCNYYAIRGTLLKDIAIFCIVFDTVLKRLYSFYKTVFKDSDSELISLGLKHTLNLEVVDSDGKKRLINLR